eukprot:s1150_g22.t1
MKLCVVAPEAKERLDFEAKIGRDLARLARSSRPGRSRVFDRVTAPKPALDVWSSGPPRGFSLGGAGGPQRFQRRWDIEWDKLCR